MNKFFLATSVLVALSVPAFAERNYDLRDSDTYFGKYSNSVPATVSTTDSQALAIESGDYIEGRFGLTRDPLEARRWDEKNN